MPGIPSENNFEFKLAGTPGQSENKPEEYIITNSTSQFNVVSSGANGKLAIFETIKIQIMEEQMISVPLSKVIEMIRAEER